MVMSSGEAAWIARWGLRKQNKPHKTYLNKTELTRASPNRGSYCCWLACDGSHAHFPEMHVCEPLGTMFRHPIMLSLAPGVILTVNNHMIPKVALKYLCDMSTLTKRLGHPGARQPRSLAFLFYRTVIFILYM